MELQEAINLILKKNCILFTGAGFSSNAINIQGGNPRRASALANDLYAELGIEGDGNLSSAADDYLEEKGESELINILKSEFTILEVKEEHRTVASLPWKRIYTTNYDNVMETSGRLSKKLITPVTLSNKTMHYKDKGLLCIHLNGYIEQLTSETLNNEFKLTESSYLDVNPFLNSEWVTMFRNDVKSSDAIFFIGFSLRYDLDLKRIMYEENEVIRKKCFFIVSKDESAINLRKISKFGVPCPIGVESVSHMMNQASRNYDKNEQDEPIFYSFTQFEIPQSVPKLSDEQALNLYLYGNYDWDLINFSISDPDNFKYYLYRNKLKEISEKIFKSKTDILIHSDLGNGKTLFLLGLANILRSRGVNVFMFNRYFDNITESEIDTICKMKGRTVIMLESYASHFNIVETLKVFKNDDVSFVFTERTMINDTVYIDLESKYFDKEYTTLNLNKLSSEEIDSLIKMFDYYGFWGDLSKYPDYKKKAFINEKCNSEIRLLLLEILRSPDIQKRFSDIINKISLKKGHLNAFLLILASNLFDFRIDLDELVYLLDDELLNNPSFNKNPDLGEVIDFQSGIIKCKSSIISESIISQLDSQKVFIDVLVKVVKKLDNRRFDSNSKLILRSIISFSRLQRVLNVKNEYKQNLLTFFEEIKNLEHTRKNPHFWLQYAIARLSLRDYDAADVYFKNAYSFAEARSGFDTFQIDNHMARHILESEINFGIKETCMQQFLKAHNILANPHDKNKNRHYPFKVARLYFNFYERFFNDLDNTDKVIFLRSCVEILNRIESYKKFVEESGIRREVEDCFNALTQIVTKEHSYLDRKVG